MAQTPPYPSFAKQWHTDTYAALAPKDRAVGKAVIISGASGGIGRAAALSFAKAGAGHIALLGRREDALAETQAQVKELSTEVRTTIHICEATDVTALQKAAETIGSWDVLVLNAGHRPGLSPLQTANVENWWQAFETNVKGPLLAIQAFLPNASTNKATVISTSALLRFTTPYSIWSGSSAYTSSKVAAIQMMTHLAQQNPEISVVSVHPSVAQTGMLTLVEDVVKHMKGAGMLDTVELAGDFCVWLSTEEARFLSGRFVCANYDVEELVQRKGELEGNELLVLKPQGWPFQL